MKLDWRCKNKTGIGLVETLFRACTSRRVKYGLMDRWTGGLVDRWDWNRSGMGWVVSGLQGNQAGMGDEYRFVIWKDRVCAADPESHEWYFDDEEETS